MASELQGARVEVRLKIKELYLHPDPIVKQVADAALQEFQKSDLAWQLSQELLGDGDLQNQFFGAQTIYAKVQQVAKGYQQVDGDTLLLLVPLLQQQLAAPSLTQQSKQRLVLAMAALAVYLCTTSWPTAIPDILQLAERQPQHGWCTLLAIPEQLSSVVHTYVKTDKRTERLLASGAAGLLDAALTHSPVGTEEVLTGTISDSPFSLALQSLTQWSKVLGLEVVSHKRFTEFVTELLPSPAGSSEVLLELILEILRSSPGAFMIYHGVGPGPPLQRVLEGVLGAMQRLLPEIQLAATRPATSLDEADADRLSRWARVAGTLVEAYTHILWVEKGAADVLVTFLGACFVVHPRIARSVFELWAILKDANRDGKLPAGVLESVLQHLALPCIASLTRFGRFDSPAAPDREELMQLRDSLQDVVVDMFCISQGTSEARRILTLLNEHLQSSEESKDWNGVEVVWFAFNGVAEALADERHIPEIYEVVLKSIFAAELRTEEQCSIAGILLRTCGPHFQTTLRDQLVPAVQWLVNMVPRIPAVASEAVQDICGYAGEHLVPYVGEFLKVVDAAAPSLTADVDSSLRGALVGIARNLPDDQLVEAFVEICGTAMLKLVSQDGGLDVRQEAGRQRLHRCCCVLLRCTLIMEQAGGTQDAGITSVAVPSTPTKEARVAATCLAKVLSGPYWAALASPCREILCAAAVAKDAPRAKPIYEYSDQALQVNILALLRYAARAAQDAVVGGPELGTCVLELVVACCGARQFAGLYAVSILAGGKLFAQTLILPALGGICQLVLAHAQNGCSEWDLVPFLELISSLATTLGDHLFQQSAELPVLTQLCLVAARATAQDILKPVLVFLQKLVMTRSGVLGQGVQDIIQVVLASFHTWPRSVNAQTYKLFCAFVERHEAVFLQLVVLPGVPAIAGLPPDVQALAKDAFRQLRGPRLRAFLGDLAAIARGENTVDMLQAYTAVAKT